jgi:Tfp pilus assembly protein PilX
MQSHAFREGSALITCTIVLVIVTVLAVGMATMSGADVEIADRLGATVSPSGLRTK